MSQQQSQSPNNTGINRRSVLKSGLGAAMAGLLPGSLFASELGSLPSNLSWMTIQQLQQLFRRKQLSPVELTRHFLKRIERLDKVLHAYITVDTEGALLQAKQAEAAIMQGKPLGALHGIPVSIKDLYMTKGVRTTQGSMIYQNHIPDKDEILVERLRRAGAIIIGKTNTPEFATFPRTKTVMAGETVNPWNTNHITGASSGGSGAAVAAGISCFAIGSDGGGSTRIPSCYNGVFGVQPSAGSIPMRKPHPVQMASAGPMTLHPEDAAVMMQVLAGPDPRDPSAIEQPYPDVVGGLADGIKGCKIAWSKDFGYIPILDQRVIDTVEKAAKLFSQAGAHIEEPGLVLPDEQAWSVFLTVNETSYHRGSRLLDFSEQQQALLTPPTAGMLEKVKKSPKISFDKEMAVLEQRAEVQQWADKIFEQYDFICTPTLGITAPKIPAGEWQQPYEDPLYAKRISTPYTYIVNVLGLTAVSIPCGFVDGLPVGLQLIGKRFDDLRVLQAAKVFSELQPWADKHPAMAV